MKLVTVFACLMLTMLAANAAPQQSLNSSKSNDLQLLITTDKTSYAPGEWVNVEVKIKNNGTTPAVVARFVWDGRISATCWPQVYRGDKLLKMDEISSVPQAQVMVNPSISEDLFITLKPGETYTVVTEKFQQRWDLGDKDPGLKASYQDANKVSLEPAIYQIKAIYAFNKDHLKMFDMKPKFVGNAKKLYEQAYKGKLTATAQFKVSSP